MEALRSFLFINYKNLKPSGKAKVIKRQSLYLSFAAFTAIGGI